MELTAHFHNMPRQGLANVLAALEAGVESFESSFGELADARCRRAHRNIASEDLVSMLHEMGIETGIDLPALLACSRLVQETLGRRLGSHTLVAGPVQVAGPGELNAQGHPAPAGASPGGSLGSLGGADAALVRELGRIVGEEHVLHGRDALPYETDATAWRGLRGTPDAVVLPGSAEEVAAVVRFACERQIALVPRGGGTGLAGGAVPVGGGVVVSLERLRAIHELSPESWRLRVGAGVSTATVKRLARENGLFFGPDPGASEQSQIGGNVATNAGGPHAFKYGSTGAWVSGIGAVVPPGEIVSFGSQLRRDVGGYDLKSLLVGSEGTLAVITAVTLRLVAGAGGDAPAGCVLRVTRSGYRRGRRGDRLGAAANGARLPGRAYARDRRRRLSRERACRRSLRAAVRGGRHPRGGAASARGAARAARRRGSGHRAARPRSAVALARGRERHRRRVRGGKVAEDIVVPVSQLAAAAQAVEALGEELGLPTCTWGHAGDGNMHANLLVDPRDPAELDAASAAAEQLFSLAIGLGGAVTGEHGIGYLKRGALAKQGARRRSPCTSGSSEPSTPRTCSTRARSSPACSAGAAPGWRRAWLLVQRPRTGLAPRGRVAAVCLCGGRAHR